MRAHPTCTTVAVEADPERAARIGRNAASLGVPTLRVVHGRAPEAFDKLPAPDAVFVGGAATVLGVVTGSLTRLYPGTYLDEEVLGHCSPDTQLVDTQHLDLDQIMGHLLETDRDGLEVVRLVSGDPSVYSALTEQTRRLDEAGVAWEVTPGVPAYAAAAALVGRELTVPLITQSVVLTRAQARSTAMPETEALRHFARTRATLVIHLATTRIREVISELVGEYGADCPVVVVYRASQTGEVVLHGTVADIAEQVEHAGLRQAAVIMVGRALDPRDGGDSYLYDPTRDRSTKS
ncbi:Precorrin-4 C(11)-methyltransferase [Nocardioides aquaticus]|uniref:Precorrin-4 C(11)-methyltransferase n=1 Tax=Nocardioides aquaticus TaxID=160826 RepID=A0ABX8EFH8_9ACTN|nr:SAM-dependent methyltransferase [Nocardioides aquaticus]QVT79244.1 Precorrin-4 C(11)-methyltransferase [Nocardioides aquaticus]